MKKAVKRQKPAAPKEKGAALKEAPSGGETAPSHGGQQTPSAGRGKLWTKQQGVGGELAIRAAGLMPWREGAIEPGSGESEDKPANPLLKMSEEDRAKLYAWLRDCPYEDTVKQVLADHGMGEVSSVQLMEFFQIEAEQHWETRISRAAIEANALVQLVEKSPIKFSSGILAALGQEAFRQVSSGQVEPASMGRIATLFLKARSDERADQMQKLKREKLFRDLQGQLGHALEKLAEEVERHPAAREAFEALRLEMQESMKTEEEV